MTSVASKSFHFGILIEGSYYLNNNRMHSLGATDNTELCLYCKLLECSNIRFRLSYRSTCVFPALLQPTYDVRGKVILSCGLSIDIREGEERDTSARTSAMYPPACLQPTHNQNRDQGTSALTPVKLPTPQPGHRTMVPQTYAPSIVCPDQNEDRVLSTPYPGQNMAENGELSYAFMLDFLVCKVLSPEHNESSETFVLEHVHF